MSIRKQGLTRRRLLGGAAAGAAFTALPGLIRPAAAAEEFKIGLFAAFTSPMAALNDTPRQLRA